MNWLNSLLRKPPPPARATPKRASVPQPPPADTAALRLALAGALDAADRMRQEAALGHALGASLQAPLDADPSTVWVAAISHSADKSVALAWLEQISGDDPLGAIACHGRFAEVRLAAAQRLVDSAALDAVARASKNKDKGVYRHCADLLRDRRERQERLQHAATIADGLRGLLERAPLSVSHLLELEREWKALEGPSAHREANSGRLAADERAAGDDHALRDCQALLAQANARILEESEAQRTLHALAAGHDELATHLATLAWPDAALLAQWHARQASLAAAMRELPAWLTGSGTANVVTAGLQSLGLRLAAWSEDSVRLVALEGFLDACAAARDATPGAGPPGTESDTIAASETVSTTTTSPNAPMPDADAQAAWAALAKPEDPEVRRRILERWEALQAAPAATPAPLPAAVELPAAAPPPRPDKTREAPVDLEFVRAQLENLEQALEAGQLAQADTAARHIKAALGNQAPEGRLDARLQRALAHLGDLRGWAQWGATKKREDLIEAAEQLRSSVAASTHNVEHLAVAIPALREEWKRLNTQAPAAKGQWESFDRALERAYVPVATLHAEESARRNQARNLREALLVQWDATLAAIDWEQPDPAGIDAQRETMLAQWRAAPHAGYRDERLMRTRFDALVRTLDQNVDAARAAEVGRREALITAVAALADVADPRVAGNQAKELQELWRTGAGPMRLRRGEEQKLWQRFRTACDAIFARRDAERAAQTAQRQEHQQARAALLEAFATVLTAAVAGEPANGALDTMQRALNQFRADWDQSSADAGASAALASGQERQARELQRQAQQCLATLQRDAVHARFAALAQAAPTTDGADGASLEKGAAQREELLIDLEIALGLTTPGASAEVRRRRQLEQLQNRFRSGPVPAAREQDPEKLLLRWYAIVAPPDASRDERIAAVVRTLVEREIAALAKRESDAARDSRPATRSAPRPEPRTAQRQRR